MIKLKDLLNITCTNATFRIVIDVLDECEKQIEYIEESKRIDKNKLYDSFVEIAKMIRSEL